MSCFPFLSMKRGSQQRGELFIKLSWISLGFFSFSKPILRPGARLVPPLVSKKIWWHENESGRKESLNIKLQLISFEKVLLLSFFGEEIAKRLERNFEWKLFSSLSRVQHFNLPLKGENNFVSRFFLFFKFPARRRFEKSPPKYLSRWKTILW